jgi:hypothetical protein
MPHLESGVDPAAKPTFVAIAENGANEIAYFLAVRR